MSTEIAKRDPRDLDLGPIRLTAISVEFTAAPTLDQWRQAFQWVKRCETGVAWWLGDMVVHGDNMFGEEASQEYERETIRKFAWVAEKVPASVRRRTLSYSHHEVVARLPVREQERWLIAAEQNGWSVKELRRQLKDDPAVADDKEPCPTCGRPWDGIYKL